MNFIPLKVKKTVSVLNIFSFHYFRFAAGYYFPGETHNFWEIVYIDRGEADIGAGENVFRLHQGQMIFHKPNEFHSIWAGSVQGPDMFVMSFSASGAAMRYFKNRILTLTPAQRRVALSLIEEGQRVFGPILDKSGEHGLEPLDSAPEGGVQMVALYLEQLLLLLLRENEQEQQKRVQAHQPLTAENGLIEFSERLRLLMSARLDGTLTFKALCREMGVSGTTMKQYCKRTWGVGAMEYYQRLRIEESRRLLREGRMNVTQTADQLGYSSVQAFSRQFKRLMGVSPREYLRKIH